MSLSLEVSMRRTSALVMAWIAFAWTALVGPGVAPARAEVLLTPFVGSVFNGDVPSSKATYGGALTGRGGLFGIELELAYTPTLAADELAMTDQSLVTLMGSVLVGLPLGGFYPYVSGGLGLMRQQTSFGLTDLLDDVSENDFGYSVGGGAWARLSAHVGLRGDLRHFRIRKSGGFQFSRAYGGLILVF